MLNTPCTNTHVSLHRKESPKLVQSFQNSSRITSLPSKAKDTPQPVPNPLCTTLTRPRPQWSTAGFEVLVPQLSINPTPFQDTVPPSGNQKCLNCHCYQDFTVFLQGINGLVLIVRSKEFSLIYWTQLLLLRATSFSSFQSLLSVLLMPLRVTIQTFTSWLLRTFYSPAFSFIIQELWI